MQHTITVPETADIESKSSAIAQQAESLEVVDGASYELAGDFLKQVKAMRKTVTNELGPSIEAAHQAHKSILAVKKRLDAPLAAAESTVKTKMGRWQQEQERKRRAEEERIRAEQRRIEEERRLVEAERLEAAGKAEEAERIIEEPIVVAPVVVQTAVPKQEGIRTRKVWKFRIVDAMKIPREYLKPDEVLIGKAVRAMGDKCEIAGIEVYPETSMAVRA